MTYLQRHADSAAAGMGDGAHVSITFRHFGATVRAASSSARAARCDDEEEDSQDGPCVVAMRELHTVVLPDLLADAGLWPSWRERARQERFASFVAAPAPVGLRSAIAVNCYAAGLRDWGPDDLTTAEVLAEAVAVDVRDRLVLAELEGGSLRPEDDDRVRTAHAVGVLMEARGLGAAAAETFLRALAGRTGASTAEVGDWVVAAVAPPGGGDRRS
ncbi:ANTAR domain-containing protein [Cellulomonas sp. Marseille-Q8402]